MQNFHNRFKSSQSAQTHPFSLHHKYKQGELKATTTWDQFPTGKNPSLSKPFQIKPSHFWQWSTAHYVHRIGTERSSCVESGLVIIVKISHFAWKKMRPNNWFFFFFLHFNIFPVTGRGLEHSSTPSQDRKFSPTAHEHQLLPPPWSPSISLSGQRQYLKS